MLTQPTSRDFIRCAAAEGYEMQWPLPCELGLPHATGDRMAQNLTDFSKDDIRCPVGLQSAASAEHMQRPVGGVKILYRSVRENAEFSMQNFKIFRRHTPDSQGGRGDLLPVPTPRVRVVPLCQFLNTPLIEGTAVQH
jgi:hypothetical protein